jgi:arylsulfatase A-like enzyme
VRSASPFLYGMRIGVTGGVLFGAAQAVALSLPVRHLMAAREWIDVVGFAALSHGVLWAVWGAIGGAALGLLSKALPRLAESPRLAALSLFVAGAGSFFTWAIAAYLGVPLAKGVQPIWLAGAVLLVVALFAGLFATGHVIASARRTAPLTRTASWLERALFPAALALALAAGLSQWLEADDASKPLADPNAEARAQHVGAQPDVVLIVLDTQRADRFGSYGYPRDTTPAMDDFAKGALLFENAMSGAIWTLPSHASLFTGLFPSEHGSSGDHRWLEDRFDTLAEELSQRGYHTAAFSNNTWVSPISNVTQGFDQVMRPGGILNARGNSIEMMLDRVLYPAGWVGSWIGQLTVQDAGARYTNRLIARWIQRRDAAQPIFLFVNYVEPHTPFRPRHRYREDFVREDQLELSYRQPFDRGQEFSRLGLDVYSAADLELMNDIYDAETRMMDAYVGQLLGLLESRLDWDNTLVIITSDHGENLGDHHLVGHDNCVYQTLAHIPMIIRFPPRLEPGRTDALVQTLDVPATVLDAVDGGPEATLGNGRSLLGLAGAGGDGEGRSAMVERLRSWAEGANEEGGVIRSLRRGRWKYIQNQEADDELYDLERDPRELADLASDHPELLAKFAAELARFMSERTLYTPGQDSGTPEMDAATRARLRALGYVE